MSKWEMLDPTPGDHIRVKIGSLYHHGIYIGDDKVIQFGHPLNFLTAASEIKVIESPIEDFLHGGFLEVCVYDRKERKSKRSPEQIIETAKSHLGEGGYHIKNNNCEHFAVKQLKDGSFEKEVTEDNFYVTLSQFVCFCSQIENLVIYFD